MTFLETFEVCYCVSGAPKSRPVFSPITLSRFHVLFCSNIAYTTGMRISVISVELSNPPITTRASGACASPP